MANALMEAIRANPTETERLVKARPDWGIAAQAVDRLFGRMANPGDGLWSGSFMEELQRTYLRARDEDKDCANITVRTLKAMPAEKAEATKQVMLQIADVCRIFHAGHKVNFEGEEVPEDTTGIPMGPGAKKGVLTFREGMPSLYPKTSLTFDYWVPKILEWTQEVRAKGLREWKGEAILGHDACTDFMRVCLLFVSDPGRHVPIAKAEDREAFLRLFGKGFGWVKKSAKREDILGNSEGIREGLEGVGAAAGMEIPLEAWSRLQHAGFVKALIK